MIIDRKTGGGISLFGNATGNMWRADIKWFVLSLTACISLLWLIIQSPDRFIYDEKFFVEYLSLLHQHGFSHEFLVSLPGGPGPLVALVQFIAEPITFVTPVGMRLVNFALLSLIIFMLWKMCKIDGGGNYLYVALSALTVPMTWVMSGLALTEIPAMLFVTASMFILFRSIDEKSEESPRLWPIIVSGFLLGIATWGRQPYALLCGAPILLAMQNPKYAKLAAVYCCLVAAWLAPLVFIWGGLAPPKFQTTFQGLAIEHMLLSLGYTGMCFVLLAPDFLSRSKLWIIAGLGFAAFVNMWLRGFSIYPLQSIAHRYLSEQTFELYGAACGGAFIGIGAIFVILLIIALWREREQPRRLIAYSGLLICAISPLFVTAQYSSRYTGMALPFLLLSANGWQSQSNARFALACAGVALGFSSLYGYHVFG